MRARKTEKCDDEDTMARMCLSFQASLVLLVGFGGERWGKVGSGHWLPRTAGMGHVGRRLVGGVGPKFVDWRLRPSQSRDSNQ
jgi:hypothetical protein